MRLIGPSALICCLILIGCGSARPYPRETDDNHMFGPVSMRIHPTFTQVKSWSATHAPGKKFDGIEAVIELIDQFGDPTRASGRVTFELWTYREATPDRKGTRLASPWIAPLMTHPEQAAHWSSAVRGYSFQLAEPTISPDRRYVLTAQFDLKGGRLFDQIIIEPRSNDDPNARRPGRRSVRAPEESPSR